MNTSVNNSDIQRACRRFNLRPETVRRYIRRGAPPSIAMEFAHYLGLDDHTLIYGARSSRPTERATAHRCNAPGQPIPSGEERAATVSPARRLNPRHIGKTPLLTLVPGGAGKDR